MESFVTIINGFYPLTIYEKLSILVVCRVLTTPLVAVSIRCLLQDAIKTQRK